MKKMTEKSVTETHEGRRIMLKMDLRDTEYGYVNWIHPA
jgi:hypothetical protein